MKNKLVIPTVLLSAALMLNSCKKEETTTSTPTTPASTTQNLTVRINPVSGTTPVDFSSVFTTTSGQKFTLSMFRYYLSNIKLIKKDGSEYPITGKYFLVTPSIIDYDLGQVPVGDYKGLKFSVGIDSLTNHKDPTVYPPTNPLSAQSPSIHWDWNSGYIFMMIEGSCDTTATNSDVLTYGQYSHSMFFHIGMDMLLRNVDLSSSSFSVASGSNKIINMQTDINKFFTNIDLKTENASHTMGSMMLATKAADNIPTMFTIVP